MIKKAPSDEQLKETVQSLLKEADLEEMTMKQICQRVRGLLLFPPAGPGITWTACSESTSGVQVQSQLNDDVTESKKKTIC